MTPSTPQSSVGAPMRPIEALQRRDGVASGENEVVDTRGAPCTLEFARPTRERNALHARSLERLREGFRLIGVGLIGSAQADEQRSACVKPRCASSAVLASPS